MLNSCPSIIVPNHGKTAMFFLLSPANQHSIQKLRTQGSTPRPRTQKKSEAKAKDSPFPRTDPLEAKDRNARGQGQEPRPQAQVISKKKVLKTFFRRKRSPKFFFRRSPTEENKKRSSQIFREVSGVSQQNFKGSKNSAVLEPRTGLFSRI